MAQQDRCVHEGASAPALATEANNRIAAEAALAAFDRDIERAARRAARKYGGCDADAQDFAQAARIRLFRVVRRRGPKPERYVRRLIKHAVLRAAITEMRGFGSLSLHRTEVVVDDTGAATIAAPEVTMEAVRSWLTALPGPLRQLVQLVYAEGASQRDAGKVLGLSQPRVAQLHASVLQSGRNSFQSLAA
jgi:RNA polymerase sigma factor (sigma-70 family)